MYETVGLLPEELFVVIFTHHWRDNYTEHASRPEVTLSHVNRRWRDISISTSQLWTRVYRAAKQRRLDSIIAYLARSNQLPIDLSVIMSFKDDISQLCKILQPHIHRLRRLEFNGYVSQAVGEQLLGMMQALHAPSLRYLLLSPNSRYRTSENGHTSLFEAGAPRLGHVLLGAVMQLHLKFPHSSITHLKLELDDYEWGREESSLWIPERLTSCPLLIYLDLGNVPWHPWAQSDIYPLRSLLTLTFSTVDWRGASTVLRSLHCESLQHLSIKFGATYQAPTDMGQFDLPSLKKLTLSHTRKPGFYPFSGVAKAFSQITELCLAHFSDSFAMSRSLFAFLDTATGATRIPTWPHLKIISIDSQPPIEELPSMLSWRSLKGYPISRLRLPKCYIQEGEQAVSGVYPPVIVEELVHEEAFHLP